MDAKAYITTLFERAQEFPDPDAKSRYDSLVGIDDQKARVSRMLTVLVNPAALTEWAKKHHPKAETVISKAVARPPLLVFEGDVGSGKTALSETIGDVIAREQNIQVVLLPLSLSSRGQGRVGEMTKLISDAFDEVITKGKGLKRSTGKPAGALILLIDEADALAQSREASQMHHEDKAGVNALIRGLDRLASAQLPVAVIMCTNRVGALDPAVKRRAADILKFARPNPTQRKQILAGPLSALGLPDSAISLIVTLTDSREARSPSFSYSDLTQRLIPAIILAAFPDGPVTVDLAVEVTKKIRATPSFKEQ